MGTFFRRLARYAAGMIRDGAYEPKHRKEGPCIG